MGMTSRGWDKAMGVRDGARQPASGPDPRQGASSSHRGSGAYSLQGEEDLFRDPFADFTPSGR